MILQVATPFSVFTVVKHIEFMDWLGTIPIEVHGFCKFQGQNLEKMSSTENVGFFGSFGE